MTLQEKGRMCKFVRRGVKERESERERGESTRNIARDKRCKVGQRTWKMRKMKRARGNEECFALEKRDAHFFFLILRERKPTERLKRGHK